MKSVGWGRLWAKVGSAGQVAGQDLLKSAEWGGLRARLGVEGCGLTTKTAGRVQGQNLGPCRALNCTLQYNVKL